MQTTPQIHEETERLEARPVPAAAAAIEKVAQAILESRLSIETTIELGPPMKVVNKIVIT